MQKFSPFFRKKLEMSGTFAHMLFTAYKTVGTKVLSDDDYIVD